MSEGKNARMRQMIEVARLYYLDGATQSEIAKQLHMSRSNVSRILTKSVESGIVEISINDQRSLHPNVAHRIRAAFGLREVRIASTHSDAERTLRKMGDAVSGFLLDELRSGMLLGITRGPVVYYASRSIRNTHGLHVNAIQMMGGAVNTKAAHDSLILTETFSQRLGGVSYLLQAPLMTKTNQLRQLLLQEPICQDTVRRYPEIDVALLQIDSPNVRLSPQLREPWLSEADAVQLNQLTAVASVCGRYYDADGVPCNAGFNDRVIAVDSDILRRIPCRIGVAHNLNMLAATVSILRSGLINVLILDESLAFGIAGLLDDAINETLEN